MMSNWINVSDRMPGTQKNVLVSYIDASGRGRVAIGQHIPALTVRAVDFYSYEVEYEFDYCEADDEDYVKESWHESIQNGSDYSSFQICGAVTHWMPLPLPAGSGS